MKKLLVIVSLLTVSSINVSAMAKKPVVESVESYRPMVNPFLGTYGDENNNILCGDKSFTYVLSKNLPILIINKASGEIAHLENLIDSSGGSDYGQSFHHASIADWLKNLEQKNSEYDSNKKSVWNGVPLSEFKGLPEVRDYLVNPHNEDLKKAVTLLKNNFVKEATGVVHWKLGKNTGLLNMNLKYTNGLSDNVNASCITINDVLMPAKIKKINTELVLALELIAKIEQIFFNNHALYKAQSDIASVISGYAPGNELFHWLKPEERENEIKNVKEKTRNEIDRAIEELVEKYKEDLNSI